MRIPRPSAGLLFALLAFLAAVPAAAQQPLSALSFMSGCWRGDAGTDREIEEHWTAAASNMMLATTRYVDPNDGLTHGWEFSRIVADSTGIFLLPSPMGTEQGRFRLTSSTPGEARFEDPGHDWPKRIIYRGVDGRRLMVRVDNGTTEDEEALEFELESVACPAPS